MKINPSATGQRVNKKALAEIFGISERTFTEYQNDPHFPIVKDGDRGESNLYDTAQVFRYLLEINESRRQKNNQSELAQAKTDEARANAAMKTLMFQEKLGVAIIRDEAFEFLSDWARYTQREIIESFERLTEELSSQFDVDLPSDYREKYAATIATRIRDYADEFARAGRGRGGSVQPAGEANN